MSDLPRFNANLFDSGFRLATNETATVEVRFDTVGQPLASIFADRAGTSPLPNPRTVSDGVLDFHAGQDGVYYIRAYTGPSANPTQERIFRYVGISRSQESSITGLVSKGAWQVGETYSANDYVTHNGRTFASIQDGNTGNEPPGSDTSDAFWQWIPANAGADGAPGSSDIIATSATSNDISEGSKTWTLDQPNRGVISGARVRFASRGDPAKDYQSGTVTGYAGNDITVLIDHVGKEAASGPFTDWNMNLIGDPGEDGEKGDTGPTGVTLELDMTWNATPGTTPASGEIMASQAPSTGVSAALSVSATDRNGDDISQDIIRWGSSTTASDRGQVTIKATGVQGQWFSAVVNGAPVFEADHYDIPVTFGTVTTTPVADASIVGVGFARTGDKGLDGTGAGDVIGPAGGVADNEFALFDGTTGKAIKGSGGTTVTTNQIADLAVTNVKMAQMPANTVKAGSFVPGIPNDVELDEDDFLGRPGGGFIGPVAPDTAMTMLGTSSTPPAPLTGVNLWQTGQRFKLIDRATWATAWDGTAGNIWDITAIVGASAGLMPLPDITGFANGEMAEGTINFDSQAGTDAGFATGWEVAGELPDYAAGGHFVIGYLIGKDSGGATHYELFAPPALVAL